MWLSKRAYTDLYNEWQKCKAEGEAQSRATVGLRESNNWLMLRVTAMEKERAVLIERMFGVKIPVPEISPAPSELPNPFGQSGPLNDLANLFNDMSDEDAQRLGISHDAEGRVVYK